ncbi:uncharacterized protein LOC105171432 isoform X2 [Sesamum indicum]|uniref:Uncharacterized protein LOC105171432 isoform X2 n=1 Tax=Sesamum indicum TaxID=4182 RepID=A0A8M8V2E7_SESIN|nr:uncharacterized protein LOC105171432 isoform X2 [Sesamum indicum]
MSVTTNLCISSCVEFVGRSQKPKKRNSASFSFSYPPFSLITTTALSFSRSFKFTSAVQNTSPPSFPMTTPVAVKVNASATVGVPDNKLEASSAGTVGATDLLIVGPGVLGRIVAEKWREVFLYKSVTNNFICSVLEDRVSS